MFSKKNKAPVTFHGKSIGDSHYRLRGAATHQGHEFFNLSADQLTIFHFNSGLMFLIIFSESILKFMCKILKVYCIE